jgi:hypothetical protein
MPLSLVITLTPQGNDLIDLNINTLRPANLPFYPGQQLGVNYVLKEEILNRPLVVGATQVQSALGYTISTLVNENHLPPLSIPSAAEGVKLVLCPANDLGETQSSIITITW